MVKSDKSDAHSYSNRLVDTSRAYLQPNPHRAPADGSGVKFRATENGKLKAQKKKNRK